MCHGNVIDAVAPKTDDMFVALERRLASATLPPAFGHFRFDHSRPTFPSALALISFG
jgi:hypothetical protein